MNYYIRKSSELKEKTVKNIERCPGLLKFTNENGLIEYAEHSEWLSIWTTWIGRLVIDLSFKKYSLELTNFFLLERRCEFYETNARLGRLGVPKITSGIIEENHDQNKVDDGLSGESSRSPTQTEESRQDENKECNELKARQIEAGKLDFCLNWFITSGCMRPTTTTATYTHCFFSPDQEHCMAAFSNKSVGLSLAFENEYKLILARQFAAASETILSNPDPFRSTKSKPAVLQPTPSEQTKSQQAVAQPTDCQSAASKPEIECIVIDD